MSGASSSSSTAATIAHYCCSYQTKVCGYCCCPSKLSCCSTRLAIHLHNAASVCDCAGADGSETQLSGNLNCPASDLHAHTGSHSRRNGTLYLNEEPIARPLYFLRLSPTTSSTVSLYTSTPRRKSAPAQSQTDAALCKWMANLVLQQDSLLGQQQCCQLYSYTTG